MALGYLAVDLGAESGRVIAGVIRDGRVELEEIHRFMHQIIPLQSGLHWDITGLWREIGSGLQKAGAWARQHDVDVASVGVDTWGVDWAVITRSGELAGLPHAYRDPRNEAAHNEVVDKLGVDQIYRVSGNQLLVFNTLFSLYAAAQASPELIEAADRLLFIPDLLHYWLSGKPAIEATIASTSQMIDCNTGGWAPELLEPLGIPDRLLQPTIPPGSDLGPILPEVARATGLSPEVRVVLPPSHDTASAVAAVPADPKTAWCYLSSGTWSLLGAELPKPCTNSAAQAAMFTNELGAEGRIRFLKNITGLWMVQECRRDLERKGETYDYAQLTQMAENAEPFRTLVDTRHGPFAAPGDMLQKIADFASATAQPVPENPGQFVRCCLESLALTYRTTLTTLEEVLQEEFDVLHVVGGGGQNRLLNQMAADATGKTVKVGPFEATALGNILTQAIAAGEIANLDASREVVAASTEIETYEPSGTEQWVQAGNRATEFGKR